MEDFELIVNLINITILVFGILIIAATFIVLNYIENSTFNLKLKLKELEEKIARLNKN